jgi:hypothetical protein
MLSLLLFFFRTPGVRLALATAGILVQVCLTIKKEALEANQMGLISLGKWNRALIRGK